MSNYITTKLRLGKRVSLVLWLIDQYTALGSNELDIVVYLNGIPSDFQRKAGGYLVFSELESERYQVLIESECYLKEELEVCLSDLDPGEPVVPVALRPSLVYRFNSSATLIRLSVFQENGEPARGAFLTAALTSDNCARARLGRQGATKGAMEVALVDVTGRMAPGDLLLMRSPESEEGEICEMAAMGVGESIYALKRPLEADHVRSEVLMPLITTCADERGEAVLAFRNFRQWECNVRLEVSFGGRSQVQDLQLELGKTHKLGKIVL